MVWLVSRHFALVPAQRRHFWRVSACTRPFWKLWFARFVPLRASTCSVARFFAACLSVRRGSLISCRLPARICWWLCFAACLSIPCAVSLVSCRFVVVSAWWVPFCRLPACALRFGWFPAASCLYLLRGCLGACVSVVGGSARFMPLGACTCFVAGSWRLPACTLALGSFRAVSCLYLLLGWFLALAYLRFGAWLVSSRFVLVPASWLVLGACLPVVGGLARFRAVSCLYLLGGSLFAAFLPVLCALAGSVPFRACTWFVARFSRLPACSWWLARFRAVSCICLVVLFLPLTCLCFAVWLVSRRFVLVLYLLRGWFLALAWVQAATDMHPACPIKKQNHLQNSLLRRTQFWVRKTFSKPASLKRACLV